MEKRKLYVLKNNVWNAHDYLNCYNCDPKYTDIYLYSTEEEAEQKAMALDVDNEIYNDCTIYTGELSDDEIINLTGYETIDEFNEVLAEPYSTYARVQNLGEDEKGEVAKAILTNPIDERQVDCANYDFEKSLDGAILVFWSWERFVGYARKLIEVRRAYSDDTEAILNKQDKIYVTQCDVLMTADEVEVADDIQEAIRERLENGSWKWNNHGFITSAIEML